MAVAGKLSGKVALVSGSGRGIGRSIALKLASEGARVVINDLDEAPANEVADEIKKAGGEAVVCAGNVTAADFGERFVKTAMDHFGGIDIIVNNAGYTWDNVIQKMNDEQWYAIPHPARCATGHPRTEQSRACAWRKGVAQGGQYFLDSGHGRQCRASQLFQRQGGHHGHDHGAGEGMGAHECERELRRIRFHQDAFDGIHRRWRLDGAYRWS